MLIYVDTNVYLDALLNRESLYVDFAAEARKLFSRAKNCEFEVLLSNHVLHELDRYTSPEVLLHSLEPKLRRVVVTPLDKRLARRRRDPYPDALHAVVAERMGAIMVTRNIKDFQQAQCVVALPERL